jgi:hypothetical protein
MAFFVDEVVGSYAIITILAAELVVVTVVHVDGVRICL